MKYCVLFLVLMVGCHGFSDRPIADVPVHFIPTLDTAHFTLDVLTSRQSVRDFYSRRDHELKWIQSPGQMTPEGDSLIRFIHEVRMLGLTPSDYHARTITDMREDTLAVFHHSRMDVLLTDAYLTLYHHLRHGRLNPTSHEPVDRSSIVDRDAITSLERIPKTSVHVELWSRQPAAREYHELRQTLAHRISDSTDTLNQQEVQTIQLNMERWRWKKKTHDRYVSVNIPAFLMRVVEKDSVWLETRVVVGKPETPTPVMESVIRSFIIYPYWHVPRSISTKEILPHLQEDASYLGRNNFEVLNTAGKVILSDTIKWARYNATNFPFVLRQREGSENSMGIIKFVFANNYGVYLHDTNSKRLYSQAKRALSHGCVRVSKAVAFAHYLVREDDIYVSPEDLDQYLSLQQRLTIELRKPIPVLLEYFTAEVVDGKAIFYEDVYKKDSVIMQRLYARPEEARVGFHSPSL